jgi:hypothetical protein
MLLSDTSLTNYNNSMTFNGTVDGAHALGLSSGYVTFNAPVGSLIPLAGLAGDFKIHSVTLNGISVTTVGDQSYPWLVLSGDNTLTSTTGNLNFWTINGASNLTTNSYLDTTITGPVGGVAPLSSLTANITGTGGIFLNGNPFAITGAQTYNGPLTP